MKFEMGKLDYHHQHHLVTSLIAPLPIALISTIGKEGYNAAPFSLVTPVGWEPPIVLISFGLRKGEKRHTVRNIEETGDFVINIMGEEHIRPTVRASANYPSNVNEIERVGLTSMPAELVKSPLIVEAQSSLECRFFQEMKFNYGDKLRTLIFGEILLAHVKDEFCQDGTVEPAKLRLVGRVGEEAYCRIRDVFPLSVVAASSKAKI